MQGTNLDVLEMKRQKILEMQKEERTKRINLDDQLRTVERRIKEYKEKELKKLTGSDRVID